jgi:hypothetical protein
MDLVEMSRKYVIGVSLRQAQTEALWFCPKKRRALGQLY